MYGGKNSLIKCYSLQGRMGLCSDGVGVGLGPREAKHCIQGAKHCIQGAKHYIQEATHCMRMV